jgi:hypothetical protein
VRHVAAYVFILVSQKVSQSKLEDLSLDCVMGGEIQISFSLSREVNRICTMVRGPSTMGQNSSGPRFGQEGVKIDEKNPSRGHVIASKAH